MTPKSRSRIATVATAASFVAIAGLGTAVAQSDADRLTRADTNGDGSIEWQEVLDMRSSAFGRMDRNSDGVVDSNDSPNFGPGKSRFQAAFDDLATTADTNQDGQITETEMMEAPAPFFEKADLDGDDILSSEELAAAAEGSR